jgi:hypothetical protein
VCHAADDEDEDYDDDDEWETDSDDEGMPGGAQGWFVLLLCTKCG